MPEARVLVIGGTRATGLLTVQALERRGIPVRVLARNPAAARARVGRDTAVVGGDVTKTETLVPAFAGVSHVVFTAGVRSGRYARERVVKATEYEGVLNALAAARAQGFGGRFVYMNAIGVTRRSPFAWALNVWKGNTLVWRWRAEEAIRASGIEYTILRAAFLLNRPANQHAVRVSQNVSRLTLHECIARADVAEALVEALHHPRAARATFEIRWERGPRRDSWASLFDALAPD